MSVSPGLAVGQRRQAGQIGLAQLPKAAGVGSTDPLRKTNRSAGSVGHRAGNAIEILQLAGGLDLGMAGQNLLDERAAGTGHAEHEDRNRRGIAHRGKAIEQRGVECLGNERDRFLQPGRFVELHFAPLQRIAPQPMLEGARIVANVFERLAQGKVDVDSVAGRQPGMSAARVSSAARSASPA